jgi:predicted RNA-binding protein with RPS1 domain
MTIRNRIKGHRRIRAGDLVPHEMNPRTHSDTQREALGALLGEIGFARSVLAYEARCKECDGRGRSQGEPLDSKSCSTCQGKGYRLKLIDGHLRQSMDPDQEIEVEILDVNDDEARKLLLSIDPLAQLAGFDTEAVEKLRKTVSSDNDTLRSLWDAVASNQAVSDAALKKSRNSKRQKNDEDSTQFLVLIKCENETQQVSLLRRFKREGLICQAKTS